jgi:cbb3-type cytochrome oxidase subunit 3
MGRDRAVCYRLLCTSVVIFLANICACHQKETAMAMTIFMLLLIAAFTGIVLWVFGRSRKARFEKDARIPLDDDKSQ